MMFNICMSTYLYNSNYRYFEMKHLVKRTSKLRDSTSNLVNSKSSGSTVYPKLKDYKRIPESR